MNERPAFPFVDQMRGDCFISIDFDVQCFVAEAISNSKLELVWVVRRLISSELYA